MYKFIQDISSGYNIFTFICYKLVVIFDKTEKKQKEADDGPIQKELTSVSYFEAKTIFND